MSRVPAVPVLALLLSVAACGGGGGGGTPTEPPAASLVFTPSGGGTGLSLRSGTGSTATTLLLELTAEDVSALYGVAFDLLYPANLLTYQGTVEGPFLGQQGAVETSMQVVETATGRLVVGASRLGEVGAVGGSGVVLTLEFRARGNGSGPFTFDRNEALDPQGDTIATITWNAGTVNVRL